VTDSSSSNSWKLYKRLLGYVRPMWVLFLVSLTGFFLSAGAEAYFAAVLKEIIDAFQSGEKVAGYYFPVLVMLAMFAKGLGEFGGEFFLAKISFNVIDKLRSQLFEKLLVIPSTLFDKSTQGKLVSRVIFNVPLLRDTATEGLKTILHDSAKVVAFLGSMIYVNWKLSVFFLAVTPIVALIVAYASKRFRRISLRIQNSMGDVTHVTSEAVTGYRVVRIFGGQEYERNRFNAASRYNARQNLKMIATKVASTQSIQVFVAAALSLLIGLLFQTDIRGDMTAGDVVQYLTLAGLLARPIKKLSDVNAKLQSGLTAARDIFEQLDQTPETDTGTLVAPRARGKIEFRQVSFQYSGNDNKVLDNLNFSIQPGQTVAVVGRSGAGKSTLASLIPRFYEPTFGEVLLDDVPLSDYTLSSLRDQIALVNQQVTLFNDTLERNIAYGKLSQSTAEEIDSAITRAYAKDFISQLPQGLETLVGDNGVLLSGGQRQRIAIARALLKDAPVLILDEATSALDTESERAIQAALEEVMRGRTTLVIAHRLSTIENADTIIVMDEGKIAEYGDHQNLLDQRGLYWQLYNSQFDINDEAEDEKPTRNGLLQRLPALPAIDLKRTDVQQSFNPLVQAWYGNRFWPRLLWPLAAVYGALIQRRRLAYRTGRRSSWRASVPVLVIGNITVGGTGKSPMVIWLVQWLKRAGYRPGIVARGYGGRSRSYPVDVNEQSATGEVGDEAPLLVHRTGVPVVVDPDRVAAVQHLLEQHECDVVICDDGLQHYALARDLEIALLDGFRGLGNGLCLPAGPLREPADRLKEVDVLINTERQVPDCPGDGVLTLTPTAFVSLVSGDRLELSNFRGSAVHAVAGIGNPERFVHTLLQAGVHPQLHAYADHHHYKPEDIEFDDQLPVIVTEKDACKIRELPPKAIPAHCFYLEVEAELDSGGIAKLKERLAMHGILPKAALMEDLATAEKRVAP